MHLADLSSFIPVEGRMRRHRVVWQAGHYLVTTYLAVTINFLVPRLMLGGPVVTLNGKL